MKKIIKLQELENKAKELRIDMLKMLNRAGSGHTGGPLGLADIFSVLYFNTLNHNPKDPFWEKRDRLILSAGHLCPIQYVSMAHCGYFPLKELSTLRKINSRLQGHPSHVDLPGIELSSDFQGGEHHILGYFIDPNDQKLKEFLETWKASKIDQIKEIIGNLQKFGFEVSSEKVINSAKGSLDRYHIVKAIFPDHEKSTEAKEEQSRFFRKFLMEKFHGGEGLAFVEREKPDIQSVINVIHDVGGMAFWAHPFWKIRDESVIRGLAKIFDKVGIDGIEVLYPYHNKEQADLLHKIARDFSLYESAGSDFHRKDDSVRQIAGFHDFGIEINFPFYEGGNT